MFKRIMVPVDMAHLERLERTMGVAAELSKLYSAPIVYVTVTTNTPTKLAKTPAEAQALVENFARQHAESNGVEASAHVIFTHDPAVEINSALRHAVTETDSDLVVMQTHVPGAADYIWASHGGALAEHTEASVMLVR